MGWAVGQVDHRWVGYGVPAECDHPECAAVIDRGLAYVCGDEHGGGDGGCGNYFCANHLLMGVNDDDPSQMCERCFNEDDPFPQKPDSAEWIRHMLTNPSWAMWRRENPGKVVAMRGLK